ncbi:hypothetical protein LTS18_009375 [Coniosporium uncinatum]|uniref:Uncharacterized protein n=1 Tax=Coniosporium uncinatum TaxID=93489 RepID=A0ACC3D124_9PEZI|nr:hypothetical protein LTS18_009375 [Coniosporium uncinatum]
MAEEKPGKSKKALASSKTTALDVMQACALAFKVVNDPRRGVLVYVRVYSGSLMRNASLWNTNLDVLERAQRLLKMYASDAVEMQSIEAGQIGVIVGLKQARTGDTLISVAGINPGRGPPAPLDTLQLRPIDVPPPVFFTSVEPNSLSEEKNVYDTLNLLLREDPSLHLAQDAESGQTHLSGMGELHLEIARDRLIQDFKAKATIGKIEIGYREHLLGASPTITEKVDREIAGKITRACCTIAVTPLDDTAELPEINENHAQRLYMSDNNVLTILHPSLTVRGKAAEADGTSLPPHLTMPSIISAFKDGVSAGLARGPQYSYPMHSTHITIHLDPTTQILPETSPTALSTAARLAMQKALRSARDSAGTVMMEPVMMVTISVPEDDLGAVVHDISSARGGQVLSLDTDDTLPGTAANATSYTEDEDTPIIDPRRIYVPPDPFGAGFSGSYSGTQYSLPSTQQRKVVARVPLKEMVGYLKYLRALTGGRGTFVMAVDRFERMGSQRMKAVMVELRGG